MNLQFNRQTSVIHFHQKPRNLTEHFYFKFTTNAEGT